VTGSILLNDLPAAGEIVLSSYAAQLAAEGVAVPGAQYVAPGSGAQAIAWDSEQLSVAVGVISQGIPGALFAGTQHPAAALLTIQFAVILLRKIPALSGDGLAKTMIPKPAQIDKAGQTNLADLAALANAAIKLHAAGTFQPVGVGQAIDSIVPLGPEGGLAGARLLFSVSLS
jgi:hypothetical protein